MSDAKKPPAFFCPACGQKHRANLQALEGTGGAVMRLNCVGCEKPLVVSLGEDGGPVCKADGPELYADKEETADSAETKKEAPAPAPTPTKSKKGSAPVSKSKRAKKGTPKSTTSKDASSKDPTPKPVTSEKAPADTPAGASSEANKKESKPEQDAPTAASAKYEGAADKAEASDDGLDVDAEFKDGDHIGRYAIERVVGVGGTSTVYRAFDPTTNRAVALKVLAKDASAVMHQRFLREIEVQANIRHQNIMPVFDRGTLDDGRPFFTMELLYKPWTLTDLVRRRDEDRLKRYATMKKYGDLETLVKELITPIADGVYVANVENGVIHRDLKPDNVLIDTRTGRPYVIDFGICHVLEKKTGFASKAVIPPTTEAEGIVGTPRFIPPEQVKGSVHARTDVWGLGATLHYVVSGEPPIAGASNISKSELKRRIEALKLTKEKAVAADDERKIDMCDEQLIRLTDPNLRTVDDLFKDARNGVYVDLPAATPAALRAVINKAMAVSTSDRYVNARQLSTELGSWLGGDRVRALTEVGGKAAAVESARRAVRTHIVTTVWLIVGLVAGIGLASMVAKPGAAPPSTRVADAEEDIDALKTSLEGLRRVADNLTAIERNRLWGALDERANQIAARLADEPDAPSVQAVREQLAYVRSIFAPPRIRIDVPASVELQARNLVTNESVAVQRGENTLPPSAYQVTGSGGLTFPIDVPLWIRNQQEAAKIALEPPLEVFSVSVAPSSAPAGMVLVLGGRVLARDFPFNAPSTAATVVPAFFMDAAEVTNSAYAQYLATLPAPERKERGPKAGFMPDPEQDGAPIVIEGLEGSPVVGIRPSDARAYAAWRAKKAGASVRLATEAEWVLAAGATMGHDLANGARGERTEADFVAPLREAGSHAQDRSPFGVRGMLGNAREMVTSYIEDLKDDAVLVKGAAVGDDPDQGAIYIHRVLKGDERHMTTGFRCVQDIPGGEPPR